MFHVLEWGVLPDGQVHMEIADHILQSCLVTRHELAMSDIHSHIDHYLTVPVTPILY